MSHQDPVLIVGSGALACLFAARLSAAGIPVVLLGSWIEGLSQIEQHGVRLKDEAGNITSHSVKATANRADVGRIRWALVLRKSWQTRRAAEDLRECLASDAIALTLQNGIGNAETLAGVLGRSRVSVGVTTTPARLVAPGVVAATGTGTITVEEDSRIEALIEILRKAGFELRSCSQMSSLLWGKLIVSAAINPLTALLRVRNGQLLRRPLLRGLAFEVGRETATVARSLSITLPYSDPGTAIETVLRQTADNDSSMLQDVLRGAPTEIDAICGAVVRAGGKAGVATPLNSALHHLVKCSSSAVVPSESVVS